MTDSPELTAWREACRPMIIQREAVFKYHQVGREDRELPWALIDIVKKLFPYPPKPQVLRVVKTRGPLGLYYRVYPPTGRLEYSYDGSTWHLSVTSLEDMVLIASLKDQPYEDDDHGPTR